MIFTIYGELNSSLLIVTNALLKEVCLALKTDHVHPLEWVFIIIVFRYTELEQKAISNEPDVLAHKARIHTNQLDWQRLSDKVHLDLHSLVDNL